MIANGFGRIIQMDGAYTGNIKSGKPHSLGTYVYINGTSLTGFWVDSMYHSSQAYFNLTMIFQNTPYS